MNLNKPAVIKKLQERFRNVNAGRGLYTAFLVPTMLTMFSTRAFAADTIWTKASAIMQDVYTQILGISTIAAVVTAAIALLLMNFSRSGRTVDESRAWLKRIIITWAILNIRDEQYKTVYVERGKCAQIEWENSAVTGQIQIRKYSSEDNTVTGQLAGTPLEGAVFEITQARSGKVVGYIVTDARGVAASGPLPLGRYFVTEVSAPKYYQLSGEKMEAEIEYPSQIIKLSAYNKPASLGVTIKKSGNYEVQSGQSMSYDFSGIANTSNVALNHFFWHDRIPTDATRALSISTGTYNARLYYKVTFKTNLNDYRTLASNLLTSNNYSLSLNAATLRLAQGEYVTDVRFEFGTVPSGFSSVVKPTMRVQVLGTVSNGYQIINRADVGGQYLNEWQTAKTTWVTTVRRFNTTPLPKTGY